MPKLLSKSQRTAAALIFSLLVPGSYARAQSTTTTTPSAQTGSSEPAPAPKQAPAKAKPQKPASAPKKKMAAVKPKPASSQASAEPDKVLYDRAMLDMKKSKYIEGRLALQTLINTYPDSEYLAKAKLGVADSYYREGGTSN